MHKHRGMGWYYSISTSLYCTLRLTVRVCPHVAWYKIIKYWLLHCVTGMITGRRAPMGVALGCYWVLADNNLVSWESSKKYIETWGGSDLYYSIPHPLSTNHGVSPKQSIGCGTGEGGGGKTSKLLRCSHCKRFYPVIKTIVYNQ